MYQLIPAWRKSIEFFMPANLKVFFLLTLNALRGMYTNPTFVLLLPMLTVLFSFLSFFDLSGAIISGTDLFILLAAALFVAVLILFVLVCAPRSSVDLKNASYFFEKIKRFFPVYALWCFIILFLWIITNHSIHLERFWAKIVTDHIWIALVLFGLFLVDAGNYRGRVYRALANAARMFWYHYPLFLTLILLGAFINYGLFLGLGFLNSYFLSCFWTRLLLIFSYSLFFMPVFVVIVTNIYIKNVYEYNKAYFPS